ncbi:MAG TPA: type II toxin-antitoxin system HicA family toxin [Chitinophagaceae bacterium]|nr:type II toxin-antitoxin system HicA family toxin [Chitinophagaceae bacterium]
MVAMAKIEKLIERALLQPTDFTWEELVKLLNHFGFRELKTGKTSGSRRKFSDDSGYPVYLHKPHPSNTLKPYALKYVIELLMQKGKL